MEIFDVDKVAWLFGEFDLRKSKIPGQYAESHILAWRLETDEAVVD